MNHISIMLRHTALLLTVALSLALPAGVLTFPTDTYTQSSVLASGKWIKVGVTESGMHFIPASTLRSWGFNNPNNVRIHGYGGQQISDRLTRTNFRDDLPAAPSVATAAGVYFYATGTTTWTVVDSRRRYRTSSLNPFSELGYYFITESSENQAEIPAQGFPQAGVSPQTTFTESTAHELEQTTLSESGHNLLGEDFKLKRSQTFSFNLPGRVADTDVWMRCTFGSICTGSATINITANGTSVPGAVTLELYKSSKLFYNAASFDKTFTIDGDKLSLGLTYATSGAVSAAHLDAINICYTRRIQLTDGRLEFESSNTSVRLENADLNTHVWDITDPCNPTALNTAIDGTSIVWTNFYSGLRRYMAWNEGRSYPAPKYIGSVSAQNLHAEETPDMIIVTPREWMAEANRLARFHRESADTLRVLVVNQDEVFNEFSSGTRDPGAFRRMFKMFFDRGNENGRTLRYALLMGRPTFDNRRLTRQMQNSTTPIVPSWQTFAADNSATSYMSDDVMAMLEDNSGSNLSQSKLSISIGRAPVTTIAKARVFVDKTIAYANTSKLRSEWKNQVLLVADDGDGGTFLKDCENQHKGMIDSYLGRNMFYTKAYTDAFPLQGGTCVGARERIYRLLNDGVMWVTYVGHGNTLSLSGQNIFSKKDVESMSNRHLPIFFTATCSFGRIDAPATCGAENMILNPSGGAIAVMAPTREASIADNSVLAASMGKVAFDSDNDGQRLCTIGDIYRNCKNITSNSTKLRYVLIGDPALRPAAPSNRLIVDNINGININEDTDESEWPEILGRQNATINGYVCGDNGETLTDFNGSLSATIYDAEYTTTSSGRPAHNTDGSAEPFQEQGGKLYSGRDSITDGRFTLRVPMPAEISDNYRPAAINLYASANDGREAIGCNRQFYIYGYDETASPDDTAPTIEYAYLNHESYTDGSVVNEQPMFIARVSDDTAINLSTAGIGHQMTLKLDNNRSFNDIAYYYTPSADGSPSGTIAYPMSELPEGNHTLTFRVWDTSGNSTSHSLEFFVQQGARAKLFDIYTDANPASFEANFYISHNRPDATLTVNLDIYNLLGHRVWTTSVTDRSDLFLSAPITWNLCDTSGRRVGRGIYIYRATVTIDGQEITTQAKRIAVTGR